VIAGQVGEVAGPVSDIVIDPEYLDVTLDEGISWTHPTTAGHTVFVYLFAGDARFGDRGDLLAAEHGRIVLLSDGEAVSVAAGDAGARFLLVSGMPLDEPVAWGGPIVMNTQAELATAWKELGEGTFVKHRRSRRRSS
jgi:quercetin 2,3-dioxygenase